MKNLVLGILGILFLVSCTSKISEVCGGSGSCCSLAFTNNTEGNPVYNFHQCVPDAGPCPPDSVDQNLVIDRIFPNNSPKEGKCGAEWETVWIWEGDFWRSSSTTASVASYMSQLRADVAKLSSESDDLPPLPPKTDKNYCLAACKRAEETGGLGLCPAGDVPNDVSVGLLRLIAKYAKIDTIPDQVQTLSNVFDEFQVAVDDSACERDAIVISGEKISNTGEMCETKVSFKSGPSKVFLSATLSLPNSVLSDVSAGDGYALFPDGAMAYEIQFDDPFLQQGYGGKFSVVTEEDDISIIATTDANSISPCMRVQPSVKDEADALIVFAENIAANPSRMSSIVSSLKSFAGQAEEYAAEQGTSDALPPVSKYSDFADPFPLSAELNRMSEALSNTDQGAMVETFLKAQPPETGDELPARYADIVTLLDMAYCNEQLEGKLENIDLARYYPKTDGFSATFDEMVFRDTQASKLLLCTRVFNSLTPEAKDVVRTAAQSFLQ